MGINRTAGIFIGVVGVVGLALGIGLWFGLKKDTKHDSPMFDTLAYFKQTDALLIRWYHAINSKSQLQEALTEDYQMLEGDIQLRFYGLPNQTLTAVMAHPPHVDGNLTLEEWVDSILGTDSKGLKLDFKSEEVIPVALELMARQTVTRPVWANANVVLGPGTTQQPIDKDKFLETVNSVFPNMTLSLGWTTGCCSEGFTQTMMDAMSAIAGPLSQPITFPARAALLKQSWPLFKELVLQDPVRYSVTVWTPSGAEDWEGADPYDMLYVRNDCNKSLIYYDLPGPQFDEFRRLAVTAGSPLNYFRLDSRDAMMVTWAHAVNSRERLDTALKDDTMMLEADVNLEWYGFPNQTTTPIMAHPPDVTSDVTLEEWLTLVASTDRGIKLDFKSIESVEPAMRVLNNLAHDLTQPIWINADVIAGPNSSHSPVNATEFKRIVLANFPRCTLSPGWTTEYVNTSTYTIQMIDEMLSFIVDLKMPITFPVRAVFLRDSWTEVKRLLEASRAHTLTVWSSSSDPVDPEDLAWVRGHSDIDRIYWDLPDEQMAAFRNLIP